MKKKLVIAVCVVATLLTLYSGIGFLLLPHLAKSMLTKELATNYDVVAEIEKIEVNPFTFKAKVLNFSLSHQGDSLIDFENLELHFHPLAYLQNTIHFSYLYIDALHINAKIDEDGAINFLKIFAQENEKKEQNKSELIFLLSDFSLKNSYLHFSDKSNAKDFDTSFGPISHNFTNLSTAQNTTSSHILQYDLNDFGTLEVDAMIQLQPFKLQAKLNHQNKQLKSFDYFLNDIVIDFNSGISSYKADIEISTNEITSILVNRFDLTIDDLSLNVDGEKTLDSQSLNFGLSNLQFHINDTTALHIQNSDLNMTNLTIYDNFVANSLHEVQSLDMKMQDFDLDESFDINATMRQKNDQKAVVNANANLAHNSFDIKIALNQIMLQEFNEYLQKFLNLSVENGNANATIEVALGIDEALQLQSRGNLNIDNFVLHDSQNKPLADFENVHIDTFDFDLSKNFLSLGDIIVNRFQLYFQKSDEGTNFDNLIKISSNDETNNSNPFALSIASLELKDSSIFIKDKSEFEFSNIDFRIAPITKNQLANAKLNATIDQFTSFMMQMQINPYQFDQYTFIEGELMGLNMQTLTPYAYNTIGREIHQGRLSSRFDFTIEDSMLQSTHNVTINNLSVSPHIPQSQANELPINLAIALLQNRDKVINLNIDIDNDLNDPEFRVNRLIMTVLANVITKTIASPFSLLGSLVGLSAQEISQVSFAAGSATLESEDISQFNQLIGAMIRRPELELQICPSYDKIADRKALQVATLETLLQTKDIDTLAQQFEINVEENDEPPLFDLIAQAISIDEQSLITLAKNRAQIIQSYMQSHGLENISICEHIESESTTIKFDLSPAKY